MKPRWRSIEKMQSQGFLNKLDNGKLTVNRKKNDSILINQLHVDLIKELSGKYMRGRLLDAGCGEKPYSLIYDELVDEAIGMDVEECVHDQRYIDVFASLDNMPFESDSFDTVLCTNVLEHISSMEQSFKEVTRVIKQGGYLILSVPFLYPIHESPNDYYRYTEYGLRHQLESNGFKIVENMTWGGPVFMMAVYFNMIFCKLIKVRCINALFCILQRIFYRIYKKINFWKIIDGKGKINKIITCGNILVAKKEFAFSDCQIK